MKKQMLILLAAMTLTTSMLSAQNKKEMKEDIISVQQLKLTDEWDKTFPKSNRVNHRKVTFVNRFGITLAADMYWPKDVNRKFAAIAVSGPFGAVKEQASGLYAQQLAERGFLAIAFDPSFTGESGGQPRYMASPDINTEDFSAAVDFLATNDMVDSEKIGILGICGWGGLGINAAANDPRIKATVASTMYDMTRLETFGYFDQTTPEQRYSARQKLATQRTEDYRSGRYELGGGLPETATEDMPQFLKEYIAYYKTPRGYHKRGLNSNGGWNKIGRLSYMNFTLMDYASEIQSPVMIVHGANAHSLYFGKTAYSKLTGNNKELVIVPNANHTDLYDRLDKIPFDKIVGFFNKNLK